MFGSTPAFARNAFATALAVSVPTPASVPTIAPKALCLSLSLSALRSALPVTVPPEVVIVNAEARPSPIAPAVAERRSP